MTKRKTSLGELRRDLDTVTDLDAPLGDKLKAYSRAVHQRLPDVDAAFDRLKHRISRTGPRSTA